ncbi:MAG: hypothetical protein WAP58_08625 [Peptococcia bacterium]
MKISDHLSRQSNGNFVCTPLILEKVCASGTKCFHDIHFLFESVTGQDIPADACPLNCIANNLFIIGVNAPVPPGGFPPRRIGDCIVFTVQYRVRVFFEFTDPFTGNIEVGQAQGVFDRELAVPVEDFNGGCFLCDPNDTEICVRRVTFDCIRAALVPRPPGFPSDFPPFAIQVTVEKEFFALQSGRSIVCVPTCVEECIEIPPPVLPGECVPIEKEAQCPCFCEESDLNPGNCAQCPPPQNCDTTSTTSSTTSTTSSTTSTTSTSTTTSTTSTTSSTTQVPVCDCFATGGGTSTLPNDAFPVGARGEVASLGFNACPGCNFNANVEYNLDINGVQFNLMGPDLVSINCNEDNTEATIIGTGDWGTASNRQDVFFTLVVNDPNNTYTLEIRDLASQLVFDSGANPITLTGQGVMVRECPLGPDD